MNDLERLTAIEAIRDLKARRDKAVDLKEWDELAAMHADDHVSDSAAATPLVGGRALVESLAVTLRGVTTVHHSHSPIIEFDSPTEATGVWAMEDKLFWHQGEEKHWLRGSGFYYERYSLRDGRWLFTYRRLERLHVETSPGARNARLAFDTSEDVSG